METVLGGRDTCQHVPQGLSKNSGKEASLSLRDSMSLQAGGPLSDQAPKVNTWCRVFALHFPLNLCACPLLASTPSACLLQPCGRHAWELKMPFICIQVCVGFFLCVNCGSCPRARPLPGADSRCQDCHAAWGWAPFSAWPAQVLCSARSAPLSEGAASPSFPSVCAPHPHSILPIFLSF